MDLKAELDLSGKVIIKVQLGDDIRRIPIHNDAITYDELVLMMQRIFSGKVTASDEITIKYKDEDGDLITINDSSDLSFAIQCSRVLKLIILMHSSEIASETKSILQYSEIVGLKTQLRSIRDQVNKILDTLDVPAIPVSDSVEQDNSEQNSGADIQPSTDTFVSKVNPSEFDPLQDKKQSEIQKDVSVNNHDIPETHPHTVPVAPVSVANQNTHVADYYGRPSPASYPQISSYGNVYPQQQYSYSSAGGFIPPTEGLISSNVYANSSQPSMQYPTPPQQQQPYSAPPTGYPNQGQGNPYSKNYNQSTSQHIYIPPR